MTPLTIPVVAGADRLRSIFHHRDTAGLGEVQERHHVGALAKQVYGDDRFDPSGVR